MFNLKVGPIEVYCWSTVIATVLGLLFNILAGLYVLALAFITFAVIIISKKKLNIIILLFEFLGSGLLSVTLLSNYFELSMLINNHIMHISYGAFIIMGKCIGIYCCAIGVLLIADWVNNSMQ